ncbi:protein YIF1B isoform X2 [Dermacentor silvarum]|uniref:protein YIF1B isoform X2 n=1 Tax=Dermacentor silvarum TaxID=543639 RepID=UPI002101D406|nr:protein YIF1B isoform X2 [Dermacentor silvarum]
MDGRKPQAYGGRPAAPQLFEDTGFPGAPYGGMPPPGVYPMMPDPMAAMAMQYGTALAGQGKDMVHQKLEKYVSVSKIKYYFAVDTSYVGRKLLLLLFPFGHTDWAVKYDQDEPVPPRYDVNAPDLYIPSMALVTYVLLSGYLLGLRNEFTPERLGLQASSALMWLTLEVLAIWLATYILSIRSNLRVLDLVAFSSYKFVSMIAALLASMLLYQPGYLLVLAYGCLTLDFFLLRTLRLSLLSGSSSEGSRRGLYLLLAVCVLQPALAYWLTQPLAQQLPQ